MDAPEITRIESESMLEDLFRASAERPVWIFKHSLVCPVSSRALAEFESFACDDGRERALAVLEIQNHRELSAALARRSGVRHESPQVLLVSRGAVRWDASHWSITAAELTAAEADVAAAGGSG